MDPMREIILFICCMAIAGEIQEGWTKLWRKEEEQHWIDTSTDYEDDYDDEDDDY